MGIVATLESKKSIYKSKKLIYNKWFTILNESTIESLVEHIGELSWYGIIRTQWHYKIGGKAALSFYMGIGWDFAIQQSRHSEYIIKNILSMPITPNKIKEYNRTEYGLDVLFDEGPPLDLTLQGDSKEFGMYLGTTYYRVEEVYGVKKLMIAKLSLVKSPTYNKDGTRGKDKISYSLNQELLGQA